jgi:hypothetical protein
MALPLIPAQDETEGVQRSIFQIARPFRTGFNRFSLGKNKRMGQDVRPQLGFLVEVRLVLLRRQVGR